MSKKRIFTIDIARAISITLVVTGHFLPENSPLWWQSVQSVLALFRMPLFMAVSGYTYLYLLKEREDQRKTYGSFVWNKFQRLMIPYFFISVFVICVKLLVGNADTGEHPVSWASFYEMFYAPAAAPFVWFVYVLFMVFLIVPFFNTCNKMFALLAIALVLHFLPIHLSDTFLFVKNFNRMLVFFVTGCLFYELRNVRTAVINTHFLVFALLFVPFYVLSTHFLAALFAFMASLCGVATIIKIAKFISEKGKAQQVFLSVAACSYTIYLFHTTFMGFAKAVFAKLPLQPYIGDTATFIIMGVTVISIGVIAPIAVHHIIIRKSKTLSYLIGAKYKKNLIKI